jgi:tetratricopeptide (TPR) repeat protein
LGLAEVTKILGIIFTRKEEWSSAEKFFIESMKLNEKYESPLSLAETQFEMGLMCKKKGDIEEALNMFKSAFEGFSTLEAKEDLAKVQAELTELEKKS